MSTHPTCMIAAILERRAVESRWETHRWSLAGVVPDEEGAVRVLEDNERLLRRLHPRLALTLFPGEAEGYYLNATSDEPSIFVSLRIEEASGEPYPYQATLSYNEAARWMDASERVERVPAWPELAAWMTAWVQANYRPEPKQRKRARSFTGKEGRFREEGSQ